MKGKKVINQNRSEFFSKILRTIGGVLLLLLIPKKLFSKNSDHLTKVEIKEHPNAVKREKKIRNE